MWRSRRRDDAIELLVLRKQINELLAERVRLPFALSACRKN